MARDYDPVIVMIEDPLQVEDYDDVLANGTVFVSLTMGNSITTAISCVSKRPNEDQVVKKGGY